MTSLQEYLEKIDEILNQNRKVRERKCCVCNNHLDFINFISQSVNHEFYTLEQLEKIWESSHIELFCCGCVELVYQNNHDLTTFFS